MYLPLNNNSEEFRTVTLQPGNFEDEVECLLNTVSAIDQLSNRYEALSYVWRSPESTTAIKLNGKTHQVTKNLESALRHLRYIKHPRVLWVDAISINQDDIEERNREVTRMGQIYSQAAGVDAWLGESFENSNLALDAFGVFPTSMDVHWRPHENEALQNLVCDEATMDALSKLFKRPWWHRMWIVQEATLAKNLTFVCGSRQITWDTFLVPAKCYQKHFGFCCNASVNVTWPIESLGHFFRPIVVISGSRSLHETMDIERLIPPFRGRICTDP
ncbi:hypothetical protein GLAREA_06794 [Glarea lozoyensis ATCC 20868]|uniref:Heterokaryon incompatibility domain-containing protein n=1 Tax=Glarea lozoyensis (strain ATCC 20868 / MF5171) TaxID=1116229 RepID=S3DNY9_GLAL2|nr:uncharacterized protein GLAREA_06794 [Glarea lozoyensis ATCC 20868]EPE33781.1 hypothetical protein GLAREA_06794 [Glarea lozoyensis ATCC 20868]